jgi:hypothetical protein
MLTRRIARTAFAAPRSLRAFSATTIPQKSPSMSDITPDQVNTFNLKQKDFREHLAKLQKEREERKFNLRIYPSYVPLWLVPRGSHIPLS